MRVRIVKDEEAAARVVAARVTKALAAKPATVLGLPTGRTPVRLYARLRQAFAAGRVDFSKAVTFNLDEFAGLPAGHPATYRAFMEAHLFDHVNLAPRRIHFLDGTAKIRPRSACATRRPSPGPVASISRFSGSAPMRTSASTNRAAGWSPTRTSRRLEPGTRRSNADLFDGDVKAVPREALSMGVGTILRSRSIVLLATGVGKADAIAATVLGPVTTRVPASMLQLHGDVEVVLDEAAASKLAMAV